MTKKLYNLMNWADIEAIVYSEEDNPHNLLGIKKVTGGQLVQFFYPGAQKAVVVSGSNRYAMEMADEEGFFAAIVPKQVNPMKYFVEVTLEGGQIKEVIDPYIFEPQISQADIDKFQNGIHTELYNILGSHPMTVEGIKGVYFAFWAGDVMRVSVVGDFNHWDGRFHQMRRMEGTDIFELFIPCATLGDNYKYEIKLRNGDTFLKADPYALDCQLRPESASIVASNDSFKWSDTTYLNNRVKANPISQAMNVCEIQLGWFVKKAADEENEYTTYLNYKEILPKVIEYVKAMNYTHIQLMPILEYSDDETKGYQTTNFFSPSKRFGSNDDFKFFVNGLHKEKIGVLMDLNIATFPKNEAGLIKLNGKGLYESENEMMSKFPFADTCLFDYSKKQVQNYMLSAVHQLAKEYHLDGIRLTDIAPVLYLDFGKQNYVANMYGGNENLEGVELLKSMNKLLHQEFEGFITICEDSSDWAMATETTDADGLGFDLKWNTEFNQAFFDYLKTDPLFRSGCHDLLTKSFLFIESENYQLPFSQDIIAEGISEIGNFVSEETKDATIRLALAHQMLHPGKKLQTAKNLITLDSYKSELCTYISELNSLYLKEGILSANEFAADGFEWISSIKDSDNIITYLRKGSKKNEFLYVIFNFANAEKVDYQIGVPSPGKYKEVFNSNAKKYGGNGKLNTKAIFSDDVEADGKENSIVVQIAPLSMQIYSYTAFTAKEVAQIKKEKEERRIRLEELTTIREAIEAQNHAKMMAQEAKIEAGKAQESAKEALKQAMTEAKKAEELEKQALILEKEATRKADEIETLKRNAKFVTAEDLEKLS